VFFHQLKNLFFIAIVFFYYQAKAQNTNPQQAVWTLPGRIVKFNAPPPSPTTPPTVPVISNLPSGAGTTALVAHNCAFNYQGNILFYIIDNKIYSANGTIVNLPGGIIGNFPSNDPAEIINENEIVIIQRSEPVCNEYIFDLIYSVKGTDPNNPAGYISRIFQLPIFVQDLAPGNSTVSSGSEVELTNMLDDSHKQGYKFAISPVLSNNKRMLFIKSPSELEAFEYYNGVISSTSQTYLYPGNDFNGMEQFHQNNSELECVNLTGNNTLRIGYSYYRSDASPLISDFVIAFVDFDLNTNSFTNNARQYILPRVGSIFPLPAENYAIPKGLEFDKTGRYLYATILKNLTTAPSFCYFDCNAATFQPNNLSNVVTNSIDYQYSAIELSYDGALYFVKSNSQTNPTGIGLSRLLNASNPGSLVFNDNAVPFTGWTYPKVTLPDMSSYPLCSYLLSLPEQNDGEVNALYGAPIYSISGPLNSNVTYSTSIVNITDDLTIGNNATLLFNAGTKVLIAPDVKITVNNGSKIRILGGSVLKASCDQMWKGIIANGGNGAVQVEVRSLSVIQDAKAAITSNSNAVIQIANTVYLNKNYRNIVINNPTSNNVLSINNCIIGSYIYNPGLQYNETSISSNLITPYLNQRTYSGIEINGLSNNNTATITMGSYTSGLLTFNNMDLGVEAINCNATIYNSRFVNLTGNRRIKYQTTISSDPCVGIYAYTSGTTTNYNLIAGGNNATYPNMKNNFINSKWGILVSGNYGASVIKNDFESLELGTKVQYSYANNVLGIVKNNYNNMPFAVVLQNCNAANSIGVNDNNIHTVYNNGGNQWGYGIIVIGNNGLSSPNPNGFVIDNNTIYKTQQAISVTSHFKPRIYNNKVYDITESQTGQTPCGIYVANTNDATIESNYIKGYGANWVTNGIRVEPSANTRVACNTIQLVGRALFFTGLHTTATVIRNKMTTCQTGLFLNYYAKLGSQKTINKNSGNEFVNYSSFTWHQSCYLSYGNQTNFYVDKVAPYYYNNFLNEIVNDPPNNIWSSPVIFTQSLSTTFEESCGLLHNFRTGADSTEGNDSTDLQIANNQYLSSDINPHADNAKWYAKYLLYNKMSNNTLLSTQNSSLQSFYTTTQQGNIGKIKANKDALITGTLDGQDNLVLNNANLQERSLDLVRKAEFKYSKKNQLNRSDLTKLNEIANECPYTHGPAVYEARGILANITGQFTFINPCEIPEPTVNAERLMQQNKVNELINLSGGTNVYPNPANKVLNINITENNKGTSISVKNQLGQTVLVETLGEVNNVLNVEKLEDGIYIIELNFNSGKQIVKFVKQ
jgi:hypothetical protein